MAKRLQRGPRPPLCNTHARFSPGSGHPHQRKTRMGKTAALWAAMMVGMVLVGSTMLWFRFNAPPGQAALVFPVDLIYYYYPMMEYAAERLSHGDVPLWNPHSCCGSPFLATTQVGVFYPGHWLTLLMPVGAAIKGLMFSEVALAGLFAAMFYRSLGACHYASGIGGILFIFACVLGEIIWPSQVSVIMWMPFLLLCVERFVGHGSWKWWAAFTLGMTLQIIAGSPQYLVYSSYLLASYAMFRLTHLYLSGQHNRTDCLKKCAGLGLGCALAAGLSAVQLLPMMELTNNSLRHTKLTEQQVHYLDRARGFPVTLTLALQNAVNPSPKWSTLEFPDGSGYLGLPSLGMIALAMILGRRNPLVYFFLAVVVVFGTLSFGYADWSAPIYRVYAALPTGGMFTTPMRLRLLVFFSLISLAVLGIEHLRTWLRPRGGARWRSVVVGVAVVLYAVLLLDLAHAAAPYGSLRDIPVAWGRGLQFGRFQVVKEEWFAEETRAAGLSRMAAVFMRPEKPIRPSSRPYNICDYEPLATRRWTEATLALGGQERMIMEDVDPKKARAIYDMASVTKIFFAVRLPEPRSGDPQAGRQPNPLAPALPPPDLEARVYNNPQAMPRAYLVGQFEVHPAAEVFARVLSGGFDYQNTVLLEKEPGVRSSPKGTPREPAQIVRYAPERVSIRTNSNEERLLVLTDTWFPGWKASVDGVKTEILRANYLFRAVRVPKGVHEVVFTYQPASFKAGLALSLTSLCVFAGLCVWFVGRSRRVLPPRHTDGT